MSAARKARLSGMILMVMILLLGVSACDPFPPAEKPGSVSIDVTLTPDGGAELMVFADTTERLADELRRLGHLVAGAFFPGRYRLSIPFNYGGWPYVVLRADDVYRPDRVVNYVFDTRRLCAALFANGVTQISLSLTLPDVRNRVRAEPRPARATIRPGNEGDTWGLDWQVSPGGRPPTADITMRPDPVRWFVPMAITAMALIFVASAIALWRRPFVRLSGIGAAFLTCAILLSFEIGEPQGDNLGVAGMAQGLVLNVATYSQLSTMLTALTTLGLFLGSLLSLFARWLIQRSRPGSPGGPPTRWT
jgi:hypothetical protein